MALWDLWRSLQTQWRTGMAGATGLDYAGVRAWLADCTDLAGAELREAWECIQAAERGALDGWAARRERDEQRRNSQPQPGAAPGR